MIGRPRYVAHVPFTAVDLEAAKHFARALARSVTFLPDVDQGNASLSEEDDAAVQYRLFCDRKLDDGRRCMLGADHDVPCTAGRRR
ncbi:hypothetical protein ACWDV4_07915 [Micromonospora sp. NPDC003197]